MDHLLRRLAALEADYASLRMLCTSGFWRLFDEAYGRLGRDLCPACPACGEARALEQYGTRTDEDVFGGGKLTRLLCPGCDAGFGPLGAIYAPADFIAADYRLLYSGYSEADSTLDEVRAFEALNPRPDGLYLNWGAGAWSRSVEVLRDRGFDVWGYEPNALQSRPFVVSRREEISAKFDGIFSNNVLEHFTEPLESFRDMRSCLRPGGAMAHATPCYEWCYAHTRFHVFFPIGRSAAVLAKRSGFQVAARVDDGEFRLWVYEMTPSQV